MDNMEYIDDYFKGSPNDEQRRLFEQRIINDVSFADDVAFYISATGMVKEQLQEDKKQRFRALYEQHKVIPITARPARKIMRYIAAATAVAASIIVTLFLSVDRTSPHQLADRYIKQHFQNLGEITMSTPDSLQRGLGLIKQNKLPEALTIFETIIKNDSTAIEAKKYAGIVSLRLGNHEKALSYFSLLASEKLQSNYGKFYEAVTLLERDKPGDVDSAKQLLNEVISDEHQEEKETARERLKKLNK